MGSELTGQNTDNIDIDNITLEKFGDYSAGFLQSLADHSHAAGTIGQYRCFIDALAGIMHAKGISLEELDETLAADLTAETGWRSGRKRLRNRSCKYKSIFYIL